MISMVFILSSFSVQAQEGIWNDIRETESIKATPAPRVTIPSKFRLMELDMVNLDKMLSQSPDRNKDASKFLEIELPMPNGTVQQLSLIHI